MELLIQMGDPAKVPLYANGLWMPLQKKYYTDEKALASWVDNEAHPANYRTAVIAPTLDDPVPYPSYKIKNFTLISNTLNNGLSSLFTKQIPVAPTVQKLAAQVNRQLQGAYIDVVG